MEVSEAGRGVSSPVMDSHRQSVIVQASAAHHKPEARLVYGTAGFRTKYVNALTQSHAA